MADDITVRLRRPCGECTTDYGGIVPCRRCQQEHEAADEIERLRHADFYHRDTITKLNQHIEEQEKEIERLRAENTQLRSQYVEIQFEIERLQRENTELLDVSLPRQKIEADNRRLRAAIAGLGDLVIDEGGTDNCERAAKKLRKQQEEIERLRAQRDEARGVAIRLLGCGGPFLGVTRRSWVEAYPWLESEMGDE